VENVDCSKQQLLQLLTMSRQTPLTEQSKTTTHLSFILIRPCPFVPSVHKPNNEWFISWWLSPSVHPLVQLFDKKQNISIRSVHIAIIWYLLWTFIVPSGWFLKILLMTTWTWFYQNAEAKISGFTQEIAQDENIRAPNGMNSQPKSSTLRPKHQLCRREMCSAGLLLSLLRLFKVPTGWTVLNLMITGPFLWHHLHLKIFTRARDGLLTAMAFANTLQRKTLLKADDFFL